MFPGQDEPTSIDRVMPDRHQIMTTNNWRWLLKGDVEDKADVSYIVAGKILQHRNQVEKLVVVRI